MRPSEAIKIIKGLITSVERVYKTNPLTDKEPHPETDALTLAISALEKQEADRWIPVTERLPKEDGRYLITEKTDGTKVQEGYFCRTRDGEPYWGYLHVTAWRPLPEPFREEEYAIGTLLEEET